jgi:catechol 2,3-dioxygenase-like lactoylglutathione lyase family enzyme
LGDPALDAPLRADRPSTLGPVEQRVSLITLGVDDVARSRAFYEALGWHGQEVEATVFFQAGGIAIVLWGRESLAADAGIDDSGSERFGGIALAHNVRTPDEVDEIISTAARAGATITSPARSTFYGGYAGYFADPDGHLWEVAHNPGFTVDDDGNLLLPDFDQG